MNAMRKLFITLASLILIYTAVYAIEVPKLQGHVNDYANMISSETRIQIEEQLKSLELSDSTQIFVLTVPSLEGEPIEGFAIRVFDVWKAGQKNKDNGVLLIVAQKERKLRIEVGRGLEGRLTDLAAGRIIDNVIKPKFKEGDYNGGFMAGVSSLVQATKGEFKAGDGADKRKYNFTLLIVLLAFCAAISFILARSRPLYGIATGVLGAPVSVIGSGILDPLSLGLAAVFGGFAATLIAGVAWSFSGKGKGSAGTGSADRGYDDDFTSSGGSSDSSDSDSCSGGGGESGGGGASGDY